MTADTCIVMRHDGKFLGSTAHWHDTFDEAMQFPNARVAGRAIIVASRCAGPAVLVTTIVTVEDFLASRYQLPVPGHSTTEAA